MQKKKIRQPFQILIYLLWKGDVKITRRTIFITAKECYRDFAQQIKKDILIFSNNRRDSDYVVLYTYRDLVIDLTTCRHMLWCNVCIELSMLSLLRLSSLRRIEGRFSKWQKAQNA